MEKIKFKQLSVPLKIAVLLSWIIVGTYTTLFIFGFLLGYLIGNI